MKRPSFQFYPSDWETDPGLKMCSLSARGLWIDMMCIMHSGKPYGHLKVKTKVIGPVELSRLVGESQATVKRLLDELESFNVFSCNEDGVIYSRRMVEDERIREMRAEGGKLGGNPKLVEKYNSRGFLYAMLRPSNGAIKIGISRSPQKRLYKIRSQFGEREISIIATRFVEDMGSAESAAHAEFSSKKDGEWFLLSPEEVQHLLEVHLKVTGGVKQTPSSSSSSSSSSSQKISDRAFALADILKSQILKLQPTNRVGKLDRAAWERTRARWAADIDKAHRIDQRPWDRLREVLIWASEDTETNGRWAGWAANIQSGAKLRQHFDKLEAAMGRRRGPAPPMSAAEAAETTKQLEAEGWTVGGKDSPDGF